MEISLNLRNSNRNQVKLAQICETHCRINKLCFILFCGSPTTKGWEPLLPNVCLPASCLACHFNLFSMRMSVQGLYIVFRLYSDVAFSGMLFAWWLRDAGMSRHVKRPSRTSPRTVNVGKTMKSIKPGEKGVKSFELQTRFWLKFWTFFWMSFFLLKLHFFQTTFMINFRKEVHKLFFYPDRHQTGCQRVIGNSSPILDLKRERKREKGQSISFIGKLLGLS